MSSVTYLQMCVGPFPHDLTSSRWWLGIRLSELLCAVLCTAVLMWVVLRQLTTTVRLLCLTFITIRQGDYIFSLFVCLLVSKTTQPISTKFGENVADGPRKNPSDFWWLSGSCYDNVMIGLGLGLTFHVTPGRSVLPLGEGHKTGLVVPSVV